MIRNRYNRIPHPASGTKQKRRTNNGDNKRNAIRTALSQQMITICLLNRLFLNIFPINLDLELKDISVKLFVIIRGVIDKFVSFFHRVIIYGWTDIIFCQYQQQSVVNRKKTLNKVRQTSDVTTTLMTSHVGDVVVKTLEDRCGRCTLSGYKCYSTNAIFVKFSDNICT